MEGFNEDLLKWMNNTALQHDVPMHGRNGVSEIPFLEIQNLQGFSQEKYGGAEATCAGETDEFRIKFVKKTGKLNDNRK